MPSPESSQGPERAQPRPGTRARAAILMVDDHPSNLLALEAILEPLGQELVKANSGEEALKQLLRRDFAAILMDVQMPGLDGFQTAALIKQRERTRTVPILFLTALSRDAAHVFKGYAHGAVDYLLKPFDPEILRSKVSVFVDLFLKEQQIQRQAELLRQREREALERQSEQRFRGLIDAMPHNVWVLSPRGEVQYANRAWLEYAQVGPTHSVEEAVSTVVHPDDRVRALAQWKGALSASSPKPFELEWRLRSADGSYRWHLARAVPQTDEAGTFTGWLATATDIDDKRRAEEARARFKTTLDATLDFVVMFSPDTLELTYANAGAARQLGYGVEELVGRSALEFEADHDEAGLRALVQPLLDGSRASQNYATHYRRRDGSRIPVEVVLQYVATDGGSGRCVSVARDITEHLRAEAALRHASEAKDAFLAAASHELRTPLAAAKGHAHLALLKMGADTESGPGKSLKIINRQIDRMAKLVEDLL
ncbi:MAG TPA: PAS domain S-box protein, partial [Aggregicoccus sp.]|nr:PAS domain S-box protein [Aggregicoccus sp.]